MDLDIIRERLYRDYEDGAISEEGFNTRFRELVEFGRDALPDLLSQDFQALP